MLWPGRIATGVCMVSLPLAWMVSALTLIAAATVARNARLPRGARVGLCVFLGALTVIGLLLGLRLGFGAGWAATLQQLVATIVAPSAWLGFRALAQDGLTGGRVTQALVPMVVAQVGVLAGVLAGGPAVADVCIMAVSALFLVRIAALLRLGADDFAHVPEAGLPLLRAAIAAVSILLGMMVATDLLLLLAGILGGDAFVLRYLTGATGLVAGFVFVVALVGTPMALRGPVAATAAAHTAAGPTEADRGLLATLDTLMAGHQLYRDSNLTLARVARRLGVPARDLSVAANRCTGESFTRYVNGHRIAHAQRLLRGTDLPVTEVMLESGFASKSSFNTEFRRVTGLTPSGYRAG